MKRSLLGMVQSILNDTNGDEVNAIADTFESEQVATVVRDTFFAMIDSRNWPHLKQFIQVDTSTTTDLPTHFNLPENVKELVLINYDNRKVDTTQRKFKEVKYRYPDDFLRITNQRNNDKDNVDLITDLSGAELLIRNDTPPQYWTSFDDRAIVFDSYDSGVDSTIQATKLQVQAIITPGWEMEDDFIPFLPEEAFTELLASAKAAAFDYLKEAPSPTAEKQARRARVWNSRKGFTAKGGVRYGNYGRGSSTGRSSSQLSSHPLDKG